VWTHLDLGLPAGNLYRPYSMAIDDRHGVLYALGMCDMPSYYTTPIETCISVFDLESEQVQRRITVDASSYATLKLIDDTLYILQRWSGDLVALDAETLSITQRMSDVIDLADDGTGTLYALTVDGVRRLAPDPIYRPLEYTFSNMPSMLLATPERIFALGYELLRIIDTQLVLRNEIDMRERNPNVMALDETGHRLYLGGRGLYVLDVESEQLMPLNPDLNGIERMLIDPERDELILLLRNTDWYDGQRVVAVDAQTGAFRRTLYETQEGSLFALAFDSTRSHLLALDYLDHALISISPEGTGNTALRIPLGIEIEEIALDPATDHLIVSDSAGRIHILDRHNYAPLARLDGGRFISLDLLHRRLYTGDARLPSVYVYDLDRFSRLLAIPQAGKPRANPLTGQVVVINRQAFVFDGGNGEAHPPLLPNVGIPFENCLSCYYTIIREVAIDPIRGLTATITYTPWPGKPGPQKSIAIDLPSGRAWYALLTGGYVHQSSIDIYPDLGALQMRLYASADRSPAPPLRTLEGLTGILALDTPARRLYVTRLNTLFVLDSETLERLGRVKTPNWSPVIRAVDEELGRLYSAETSKLIVWMRQGGKLPIQPPPQPFTPTDRFDWILPSPNFAQDRTLLAYVNQRLVRSTDDGETWQDVSGGIPTLSGYPPRFVALFSPNYANDRTIWAGAFAGDSHGEGIWVSTDGGDTWQDSSRGLLSLRVYRLINSPNFVNDHTLLAYAHEHNGKALYRSTDAGQTWQLVLRQTGYDHPPLPDPAEMFGVEQNELKFKCQSNACYRSDDGGQNWQTLETGNLSLEQLVDYAISPFFQEDRTVYFMTQSALYRATLLTPQTTLWERCLAPQLQNRDDYTRELSALAIAPNSESTYDLFIGTAAGEFYRLSPTRLIWESLATPATSTPSPRPTVTATSAPTLSPTPCTIALDERLQVASDEWLAKLGCATAPAVTTMVAYQPFENGRMFWRADRRQIYVLQYDGTWRAYEDTWDESQPIDDPQITAPELYFKPIRGFGKLWREQLGGPDAWIGWATAQEYGYETVIQNLIGGLVLRGENTLYLLYNNGTWEAIERPW